MKQRVKALQKSFGKTKAENAELLKKVAELEPAMEEVQEEAEAAWVLQPSCSRPCLSTVGIMFPAIIIARLVGLSCKPS
jgi:hypothetical protein